MLKIIALFLLLSLPVAGVFLYFKKPSLPIPIPFLKAENLLSEKSSQPDVLSTTYNNLVKTTTKSIDNAKEKVHQSAQNTLDNVFDKNSPAPAKVSVVIANEAASQPDEKVLVDLATSGSLKLNLIKGKEYFISFKNAQVGNCLFINNDRYELKDGTVLKVSFAESGVYKVKTGPCATLEKEIGELVVN